MEPKISVILCTYNAPWLVKNCLDSILRQDYRNLEILCVDGMSRDSTREVVKAYMKKDRRIRLILNKKKLPEGLGNGKWLAFNEAKGEIIAIIDQDNILQRKDLFAKAAEILHKKNELAGVLGGLTHDKKDSKVVRYVSLVGTDSFFAYRSIDFLRNLRNAENEIEFFELEADNISLTGGNCFFYRKSDVKKIGGYDQDVRVIKRLIQAGKKGIAVLKNSTKHYAEKNLFTLMKKALLGKKAYYSSDNGFDYLPASSKEFREFAANFIGSIAIVPKFYYSAKILSEKNDGIILFYPLFSFLTTISYVTTFIRHKLSLKRKASLVRKG